ncbi:MAG: hypothetical protein ABJA67_14885 [Chthonomonadales bacterium]
MSTIKTAISLDSSQFNFIEHLAKTMNTSRSKVIGNAIDILRQREEEEALTRELNEIYSDPSNHEDPEFIKALQSNYVKVLEPEEW